ncbi:hypothetical protein DPMN_178451 [Dreissena polymorpha]|uniref:Uncharacterized protein n=1 Tax=Dreissena polymorpha TaxID=45954 RepID=A0A9D4EC50_DREPO|nr:hypothetical protein DPMN_178450 [Dreissena polymorpha]KAH3777017.1 hypothetical protein DPMN_178451 [Dreissena polymorpha]
MNNQLKIRKHSTLRVLQKIKITQIDEAADKLEFHSLRENLLFHGIAETSSQENCDEIIKTHIKEVLHIDKNIILDRPRPESTPSRHRYPTNEGDPREKTQQTALGRPGTSSR